MSTKEYSSVRDCVGAIFSKRVKGGEKKWLPSVLSIMADLLDVKITWDDEKKCRAVIVECKKTQCRDFDKCEKKLRQFYIRNENHRYIFEEPNQLPNGVGIFSKEKKSSKNMIMSETEPQLVKLKGEVVYKHYERGNWESCPCGIEEYKAVLSSIFFFCPDILWEAISNEINHMQNGLDSDVTQAIMTSLNFYIVLDEIEKGYSDKSNNDVDEIVVMINNAHIIPEIEEVIVKEERDASVKLDRISMILDAGSAGMEYIRRGLSASKWKKEQMVKVMGKKNCEYLLKDKPFVY